MQRTFLGNNSKAVWNSEGLLKENNNLTLTASFYLPSTQLTTGIAKCSKDDSAFVLAKC